MTGTPLSDRQVTQNVTNRLANRGVRSPCNVSVQVRNGEVTLSGTVQFAHQKTAAVQAASSADGVRRVFDRTTVKTRAHH